MEKFKVITYLISPVDGLSSSLKVPPADADFAQLRPTHLGSPSPHSGSVPLSLWS